MEFSSIFSDIKCLAPPLELVENPLYIDIQVGSEITRSFDVEKSQFEEEMIDLQHNYSLKARHYEVMPTYLLDALCFEWSIPCGVQMCKKS